MTYVIMEPYLDAKNGSCVKAWPVDPIHPDGDEADYDQHRQLYINLDECIDCVTYENGHNRLACKLLMQELPAKVTIQPLPAFAVIKDLVVDLDPFFAQYEKVLPYLINDEPPPQTERLQTPVQRERYDESIKCILCACCTSSCPVIWANRQWVGSAAIVKAHRFLFDSRDRDAAVRLELLSDWLGIFRCRTVFRGCLRSRRDRIQAERR